MIYSPYQILGCSYPGGGGGQGMWHIWGEEKQTQGFVGKT
jgi:hypothetical protein